MGDTLPFQSRAHAHARFFQLSALIEVKAKSALKAIEILDFACAPYAGLERYVERAVATGV